MKIGFVLNVFGWQIGTFDIHINVEEAAEALPAAPPKLMDSVSDYFASRWFARHA